jgi:hypothetical protein
MKTIYFSTIIAAVLFMFSSGILAQPVKTGSPEQVEYYKVSEVRITINSPSDIMELRKQGLGFESMKLNDTSFDVLLDSYQLSILKKTGYKYEILIDDVTKDYLERTKESREILKLKKASKSSEFGLGSMGGFYTFNEVVAQLDSMRKKYPNLITAKDSIGTSIEGRTIWAVKISDNPDIKENEPEIFYNSLTHSKEPQGMMVLLYFMYHLLENYGTDPEITYLVNNRELYFVPVINPDGYVYVEKISPDGGGEWKKNRRDLGGGIFGVNLNANFGFKWGFDDIGSSPDPQSTGYRGTGPFSEPETQAVREFCIDHHFLICHSYHSYGPSVFPPWGYVFEQTPDSTSFNFLVKLASAINGYPNGLFLPLNPVSVYTVNGYTDDWMYGETTEKNKIFAITTEVGRESDGGFWPRPERITPLAEENLYANLVYAWGPGIIENPPFISDGKIIATYLNPKTDSLKFNAIEQNPDNHTSKVYGQLLNSKDSIVSETLLTQKDSTFRGTLNLNSFGEDFYKVRYRQSGTDIPSNLYFGNNLLRFTTIPLIIDNPDTVKVSASKFTIQPSLKNAAKSKDIINLKIKLASNDPWIKSITPAETTLSYVKPGQTRKTPGFTVSVDTTALPKYFNMMITISSNGYVYWTDSIKITPITGIEKDLQQTTFHLEQNYPNPFNSVTTISWQIAKNSKVTLKVLDIVGRTVATLVDEQRPLGKYETRFNAAALPKGIYFCQLRAGEFTQTRKMILLE